MIISFKFDDIIIDDDDYYYISIYLSIYDDSAENRKISMQPHKPFHYYY